MGKSGRKSVSRRGKLSKPRKLFTSEEILQVIDNSQVFDAQEVEDAINESPEESEVVEVEVVPAKRQCLDASTASATPCPPSPEATPITSLYAMKAEDTDTLDEEIAQCEVEEEELPFQENSRIEKGNNRSSGTGRKKDQILESFETTRDEAGKIISNLCKNCSKDVSGKACRMVAHVSSCKKKRTTVPTRNLADYSQPISMSVQSNSSVGTKPFASKGEIHSGMKRWLLKSNADAKERTDLKVGKYIFSSNTPFRQVQNPHFKELVRDKVPGYVAPSVKRLRTTILNEVYQESMSEIREGLKNKKVVIIQDGWSTTQNSPVVSHCLHTGSKSVFFDAISTETNKKTAEYCYALLNDAINKAENEFACNVVGVVTDNCSVMKALKRKTNEERPNLFVYGCNAHIFNLLGQDLTNEQLVNKIVTVQKHFRNHHFESSALKSIRGKRPLLPATTRWNSQLDCLRSYRENQIKYYEISRMEQASLSQSLVDIIEDKAIYTEAGILYDILLPIAKALDEAQSDKCTLADVCQKWLNLKQALPVDLITQAKFNTRKQMGMTPITIAAFMLHPIYKGIGLSKEEFSAGFDLIGAFSPVLVGIAASLKSMDITVFPKHFLESETIATMSASCWWNSMKGYSDIAHRLIDFCESLMILPASSAAIERSFSTLGEIMTKKRNRLHVETAKKLCVVYKTLSDKIEVVNDSESDLEN